MCADANGDGEVWDVGPVQPQSGTGEVGLNVRCLKSQSLLRRLNGNHLLLTGGMGIEVMILWVFFHFVKQLYLALVLDVEI